MNGPFGNGFPYTNFHELNMDWIIKIAKDFLDQYSTIQQLIDTGKADIEDLTSSGLEQLASKTEEMEGLLDAWYAEHSDDISNQLADAISDLNTWYTNHEAQLNTLFNTKIATFETNAYTIAQEVISTIPSDYTDLSNDVEYLLKGVDPVKKYRIDGVSVSNIANPQNPAYGGNIADGTYPTGYDAQGIQWGFNTDIMTLYAIDVSDKWLLTIPKDTDATAVQVQYLIVTNSSLHGLKNINADDIDTTDYDWYEPHTNYSIVNCEKLLIEYPTAKYIFVAVPNSDANKYVYDNDYHGSFIQYDGERTKTIDWLSVLFGSGSWTGKKICTYGDSLMNQGKTTQTLDEGIILAERIGHRVNCAKLYDRSFPGSSVSVKLDANITWILDSAVTAKNEIIMYEANPTGTTPTGVTQIPNTFCASERIATIPEDTNLVLIMGGYNDVFFKGNGLPITQNVNTGDESYFTYAYARTIERIQARIPTAQIALVIEPWCSSLVTQNYISKYEEVVDNIHWLGEYYHIPVIDLYNSGSFNSLVSSLYIKSDGTHPTTMGEVLLTNHITGGMKLFSPSAIDPATTTPADIGAVDVDDIVNNLTTPITETGKVLDARQGKVLKDLVDGKLNTSDIANNLTTATAGKVLDATQGKWLKDNGFYKSIYQTVTDLDNTNLFGVFFAQDTACSHMPTSNGNYYMVICFSNCQMAIRHRNPRNGGIWVRHYINEQWYGWAPVVEPLGYELRAYASVPLLENQISVNYGGYPTYGKIRIYIGYQGGSYSNFVDIPVTDITAQNVIENYRLHLNNIDSSDYLNITINNQAIALWASSTNVWARVIGV